MKLNHRSFAYALAAAVLSFSAAPVQAMGILEVQDLALASDPQLLAAQARSDAAGAGKLGAWSNFLPQLSGNRSRSRTYNQNQSTAFRDTSGIKFVSQSWSLRADLSLFRWSNFAQLDRAEWSKAQGRANYAAAYQDFLVRVATIYFGVLGAEDNLNFARSEEKAIGRQLDQAKQRFDVGLTAVTDVHEAQASFDAAQARTIVAENALDDAYEGLRELTGEQIKHVDGLVDDIPLLRPDPEKIETWVDTAVAGNPGIATRMAAKKIAEADIEVARSGYFPTVDLNFQRQSGQRGGVFGGSTTDNSVGISINVPIFTFGKVTSQVRVAAFNADAADQDLVQQQRLVRRQTRNNYRQVVADISQVQARKQAVVSAQSALDATQAGFEVGTRTIVDTLLSQRQLYDAQRQYAQARYDYLLAVLKLKQSAGNLGVGDTRHIQRLLTSTH